MSNTLKKVLLALNTPFLSSAVDSNSTEDAGFCVNQLRGVKVRFINTAGIKVVRAQS